MKGRCQPHPIIVTHFADQCCCSTTAFHPQEDAKADRKADWDDRRATIHCKDCKDCKDSNEIFFSTRYF